MSSEVVLKLQILRTRTVGDVFQIGEFHLLRNLWTKAKTRLSSGRSVILPQCLEGGGVLSEKMIRWQEGVDRGGC